MEPAEPSAKPTRRGDTMTPCEKKGYKVGDRFRVVGNNAMTFSRGSLIELYTDDGTSIPLFELIEGGCSFTHADGRPGAYLCLHKVEPARRRPPTIATIMPRRKTWTLIAIVAGSWAVVTVGIAVILKTMGY